MKSRLTIGELAGAAEVATSTVRYYERAGLLRASGRSPSNYRFYSQADLHRLRFIRAAQATGFALEDVKSLLRPTRCANVQGLIAQRLEQVNARMNDLRHVRKVLKASLDLCLAHQETGRCRVIETLSASARPKSS